MSNEFEITWQFIVLELSAVMFVLLIAWGMHSLLHFILKKERDEKAGNHPE